MSKKLIQETGRRKQASAAARLTAGKGKVTINSIPIDLYGQEMYRLRIKEPLILAEAVASKVDIAVTTRGGGPAGQADAARLAIAKALVAHSDKLETVFADYDRTLLVADVRRKEPRKPNTRGHARAKRQKSYR